MKINYETNNKAVRQYDNITVKTMVDPTQRFSDRVTNYLKYRPHYPKVIIPFLKETLALNSSKIVADVGSGTGFLTQLFLDNGNQTYGIEPNTPMREAAEFYLKNYPNFISINASAEHTTLPTNSIDYIVVGQAFHWFDKTKAKQEFQRILKPNGRIILIWNQRLKSEGFMKKYEAFSTKYADKYEQTNRRRIKPEEFEVLFDTKNYGHQTFPNAQYFDFEGLKGRYLSSSYAFNEQHPNHDKAMNALLDLFKTYQKNGRVEMRYETHLYFHHLE